MYQILFWFLCQLVMWICNVWRFIILSNTNYEALCKNSWQPVAVYYFRKKFTHIFLTGSLIRLLCYIIFVVTFRYYPYHYSPYISDVANFEITELHFDMAQPFRPFEQLLAVLPAASRKLLPSAFQVRIFCSSINFHIENLLIFNNF